MLLTYVGWNYFGIDFLSAPHILILTLGFITGVYFLYDLLYMEIPDEIMVPAIFGYLGLLLLSLFIPSIETAFFDRWSYGDSISYFVIDHIAWAWILYSFLYLQILIPWGWYLASRSRFKDLLHLIASYILFPLSLIWWLFTRKGKNDESPNEESLPTWVGGGDLRIALFIWLTLGTIHGIASFAFAYIIGSIVGILLLILGKLKKWGKNEVPFWPFLALGWIITIFFHEKILEKMQNFLDYL
jgi:prepilin signal peptidase PulO-like enzyme (type II secretory pathway)